MGRQANSLLFKMPVYYVTFSLLTSKSSKRKSLKALQFSSNSFNVYPEVPANEVDEETMRTT